MNISALMDHAEFPRHRASPEAGAILGHAANPLCSDALDIGICVDASGNISSCTFSGDGCALAIGSASLFCTYACGKRGEDILRDSHAHLLGERVGPMREGCTQVIFQAFSRAWKQYVHTS